MAMKQLKQNDQKLRFNLSCRERSALKGSTPSLGGFTKS
jgi:hypothetical protein